MKRLLNTLYVTTDGAYLSRDGETVRVQVGKETKLRVPIHTLGGIVCIGRISCSPPLLGLCGQCGVTVSFLSDRGRFLARVEGPVSGNVLLRREQFRQADQPEKAAELARSVVIAKVVNCRTVLLRAAREESNPGASGAEALREAALRLARILEQLQQPLPLEAVRGREGEAAKVYFNVFDHLIVAQKDEFYFRGRNRRPPLDNMNSLLSFLYTLLVHDTASALEAVGLDPAVGYLHRDRPGRPGLALDVMEELRPILADRIALSLVNRKQVQAGGFSRSESGAVIMEAETRKTLLVTYQKRKQEEIHHPFLNERISLGLLPHAQALLLARRLRGDLDAYPAFLWR